MESPMAHQVVLEEKILENRKLKDENDQLREENFELKETIEQLESQMPDAFNERDNFLSKDSSDEEGDEKEKKVSSRKKIRSSKVTIIVNAKSGAQFQDEKLYVLKLHLSTKMRDLIQRIYHKSKILPHIQELFFTGSETILECKGCLADHGFEDLSSIDVKYRAYTSLDIDIEVHSLTEKLMSMTFNVSKTISELKPMLGVGKGVQRLVLTCLELTVTYTDPNPNQPVTRQETRQEKINPGISVCDLYEDETISDILSHPAVIKAASLDGWIKETNEDFKINFQATGYIPQYTQDNKLPKLLFRLI